VNHTILKTTASLSGAGRAQRDAGIQFTILVEVTILS
jgi:hypothetical protein